MASSSQSVSQITRGYAIPIKSPLNHHKITIKSMENPYDIHFRAPPYGPWTVHFRWDSLDSLDSIPTCSPHNSDLMGFYSDLMGY